jgi:broad specificity phosphatase PhoE
MTNKRLVLLRHGQSEGNVRHQLDTAPPGTPLTELGRQQAAGFAARWSYPIGLLVHSVARRAIETAAEIDAQLGIGAYEVEGIHEVQAGDLEGSDRVQDVEQFDDVYRRWQHGDLDAAMPGGESGQQVLDRYLPVVNQLRLRHLDDHDRAGDVVVVSHGAAIRLVAAVLAGVDPDFALEQRLANTEYVVLSPITDGRWSCVQWGALTPPFYPEPVADHAGVAVDPMG